MTILDRYLVRRMLGTMLRVIFAMVFLFVTIDLLTHRQDNIIKYEIPWPVVAEYYLVFIPRILFDYQAVALSVLVAGLMVLGRAAQDNEITAALAGGISLRRLAAGPIALALVVSVLAFALQETLGTRAVADSRRIEREYFSRFDEQHTQGVSWNGLGEGWMCYALKFNREALTGQDVYIHRITPERFDEIRAGRIWWSEAHGQWLVENGIWMGFNRGQNWEQESHRITQAAAPFSERPESLFSLEAPASTKNLVQLGQDIARAQALGMPVQGARVEYHAKIARPALAFIMVLLAVPFAVRVRRGGLAVGFGLSVAIGVVYVLLFYGGLGLGHLSLLPPVLAAWAANLLFLAAGVILFRRVQS